MQQQEYGLSAIITGVILIALLLMSYTPRQSVSPLPIKAGPIERRTTYEQTLHFNIYTFSVQTPDTGTVRVVSVKAWRGQLLLTNFTVRVDGAIVRTEVGDLDANRFPELYIFSQSSGSGSFGRVYGWQFLPERKADITPLNWQLSPETGYMGHDSLWLERDILCRQFPRYQPGDTNASPTGDTGMMRYQLRPAGQNFILK